MLKEEPLAAKYAAKDYLTQPGQAKLDPQQDSEVLFCKYFLKILLPAANGEMNNQRYYDENKYWLMDEVERYMKSNQEQINEKVAEEKKVKEE